MVEAVVAHLRMCVPVSLGSYFRVHPPALSSFPRKRFLTQDPVQLPLQAVCAMIRMEHTIRVVLMAMQASVSRRAQQHILLIIPTPVDSMVFVA